jgi:hypothetical protein
MLKILKMGCIHECEKTISGEVIAVINGIIIPMLIISANALKTINKINNINLNFKCNGIKFFNEEIAEEIETLGKEVTLNY